MTLETVFKKFDLFADTPKAVAKMRELVRHLAITGKLVPQKPDDEPASLLLDRIAAHKIGLAKSAGLQGGVSVTPMPPGDGPFAVPSTWTWVRFGEIMVNRDGERIPISREERATKAKTYDYYGASGIIDKIDGYLFDKPLLLIGEDGANLINRSTPIAFMARGRYWVNNHAHVLDGLCEAFLRYIELHINAINLEPYVTGSAQPKMNQAKMNSIPIALPPLAEQKRIVAKVDELMALCDRLESQQQERQEKHIALARASLARFADAPTPANLNFLFHKSYTIPPTDLRKSILTLAVRGKLVAQDPADSLSDSIPEIVPSSPPFDAPETWRWTEFGEIGEIAGGFAFKSADYAPAGVFILRVTNIAPSGVISKDEAVFLPPEKVTKEVQRFYLNEGDILLVMVGGSLGKIGLVTSDILPALLNQNLWRITPVNGEVDSQFLRLITDFAVSFQRQITHSTHGHLSREEFRKKPVAFPPLAEQRRIVGKVHQLMALVDQLETQLAPSRATAEKLMQALVAELTDTTKK